MDAKMLAFLILTGVGLLYIGLSVLLIMRKIPPNPICGVRVPKTMNNLDIWYKANAYCGWTFLYAGIVTIIANVAFAFVPGLNVETYTNYCLSVSLAGVMISAILTLIYLRSL